MTKILEGQVLINGTDIWKEYGVFLTEEKEVAERISMPFLLQVRQRIM